MDASTGLTCVACKVVFAGADLQRDHYKSDWHRYNLKRQTAELSPITLEQYNAKVETFANATAAKPENESHYCTACKKKIKSTNAWKDHVASKKNKDAESSAERKGPKQPKKNAKNQAIIDEKTAELMDSIDNKLQTEDNENSEGWETDEEGSQPEEEEEGDDLNDVDFDEMAALPVNKCLFCPQTKENIQENKKHMKFHHGFSIPEEHYVCDEIGLFQYLGLKVGAGRCCLFCPDRKGRYQTIEACQSHMRDKEHCRLRADPESMIELTDYYDFTPLYNENGELSTGLSFDDGGWSLTLPSGAKVGHRSLVRYYKQYLKDGEGGIKQVGQAALDKAKGLYPALAWTGNTTVQAKRLAKDLKFIDRYRRKMDIRSKSKMKLFKTQGRVGDN